ncbi:MAG TPA: NrfD/PsrC family molybdoenzyme membrane anchor subunit [Candidatus Limnocylindria bacterium]|nr:NrfD/PsrC family molybdoenzyme membrane anchor subunit [Candidatus Limnocylindria bacterium]
MPPEAFGWEIWLYFFIGGVAGGALAAASIADLVRDGRERALVLRATLIALPLLVLSAVLLTVDLGRPDRTLNLLTEWRATSPMWWGTWILMATSAASAILLLRSRGGDGRLSWVGRALLVLNIVLAGLLVVYTGVLLSTSSRPLWSATPLVPVIFALSAFSTGIAALAITGRATEELERADTAVIVMEAVAIAALLGWLALGAGPVGDRAVAAVAGAGLVGAIFWIGVVGSGLLAPLLLARGVPGLRAARPALVLLGGLALRIVIVVGGQSTPLA